MKVYINNGPNGTGLGTDYTRYVIDGSLSIEDSLNVPTLITFQLSNIDQLFVVPRRSSYVTIVSEIYGVNGGYGSGKILATGFVTNEPERTFLGLSQGIKSTQIPPNVAGAFRNQIYSYNINVTSDEWLLNSNSVPYIPAFVNQTDSQILASIAQALMPGFFNTSQMASGNIVPYYQYDPSQTWSDIAKTFGDANRYHYKVINKSIIYQPFGDCPLGIAYDDTTMSEKNISPLELVTGVVSVPPVNDCIVIGDTEPQTNWDNYFIGDGFSSNFQLKHIVFDGTSAELLSDDWTESVFTQGTWTVNDPLGVCLLTDSNGNAAGSLNIVQKGALGVYTPANSATYIQSQNGLELGGGLNLQHGQFVFNDTASGGGGVVGGIYGTSLFTPGNCLAGFGITGQTQTGPFNVSGVQIANGNTPLVYIDVIASSLGFIQPGYVLTCSGFYNATFLNGTKQVVQSISNLGNNVFQLICQGLQIWTNPYPFTPDTGQVTAKVNDVLVTASGAAGIVMQPILNGQFVGQQVVSQINHQYVLQTWIGANTQTRYTRQYGNLTRSQFYGGQNLAASGAISWVVTDVNLGNYVIEQQNPLFGLFPAAPAPVVTQYTATNVTLPPFALYCLINGIDLNVSINYTVISSPPQGFLTVQSLTGASGGNLPWFPQQLSPPIVYQLGYGMINQTAQIGQQGESYVLQFYTDDIPSVGARIRFLSWSSGQSIARVRDTAAVQAEAAISGDSGVRSAIFSNLSPLPRSSDECEAAAAASITDREYPQFQGTYTVVTVPFRYENLFSPSMYDYPKTGEFLWINSPVRGVSGQNFFANTVRIQLIELKQEILNISVDYGPDLYLEKLLPAFQENEQNLLVPKQTAKTPNYITIGEVLNAYLPTLDNAQVISIVNSLTGNYILVDLGAPPITACEVRNIDSGWGIADAGRVGYFTSQTFTLPRSVRDQTYYLRAINGSLFSRFSKALRVVYPLVPSPPTLVSADSSTAVFDYAGDVRDIYGLELRAFPATGILFYIGTPTAPDSIAEFSRVPVPVGNVANNVLAVYNPPSTSASFPYSTQLNVGDIIYTNCPNDGTFTNIEIVTNSILGVPPQNAVNASGVCFIPGTTAYFLWDWDTGSGFQSTYPIFSPGHQTQPINQPQYSVQITSLQFNSPNAGKGVNPWITPILMDIYDQTGGYHGNTPVPPNYINDGHGPAGQYASISNQYYDMIISGGLYIPVAGNYTFQISVDDGFLWGIAGGASYVSGTKYNPIGQTVTALCGFPVVSAQNTKGNYIVTTTINFPHVGTYAFEIDYAQYVNNQNLCVTCTQYPAGAFSSNVPTLAQLGGRVILPAPINVGFQGTQGTPWEFGWFDYGNQTPDVQGQLQIGVDAEVGEVQQIQTGVYTYVASGSISGGDTGVCTILTQTPHGFTVGENIIIGCGWVTWPNNLPTPPQTGTVFCGQQVVTNVLSVTGFQFIIPRFISQNSVTFWEQQISASGVNFQIIEGVCAPMPTALNTNNLALASGIILQRPIFAPSDLVVDFTQPDIAEALQILQAISPDGMIDGLSAYFFNLTWDYSYATDVTSFVVPQIINIIIDSQTQQVQWQVQGGNPTGYRISISDSVTGITYNRFTIDHSDNPHKLNQFKLNPLDFASTRDITITPFGGIGDGPSYVITNVSQFSITGSQSPGSYTIGCTYNGTLPASGTMVRIPFDVSVQYVQNFTPSQAILDNPPTNTYLIYIYQQNQASGGLNAIGYITFSPGSQVGVFTSYGSTIMNFSPGNIIKVITQGTADPTAANLGFTISGIKN